MCIHSPDNFSDHFAVFFSLAYPYLMCAVLTLLVCMVILSFMTILTGIKLTTSIEPYKICVQASLPTLSNELQALIASCINLLLTMHVKNCFSVCIILDNNVFLSSVNVLRLCQDGMTLLDHSAVTFYFRIICGQMMVVPPVVFYRKSGEMPSLATSLVLDL